MIYLLAIPIGMLVIGLGYLISKTEKKAMAEEIEMLKADVALYAEAVNRSPYPVDVEALRSEFHA